jgi:hypothetical protein
MWHFLTQRTHRQWQYSRRRLFCLLPFAPNNGRGTQTARMNNQKADGQDEE